MTYTYNINGGKYHYMHVKYYEAKDILRFRIREVNERLEIKISHLIDLIEQSINDRCGDLDLVVADIVNQANWFAYKEEGADGLNMFEKYLNDFSVYYAVHTIMRNILDIEN